MLGYFLSEDACKKLGLDKKPEFKDMVSKNVISFNEEDFDFIFSDDQKIAFAEWFYNTYGDGIVECAKQWVSNK